MDHGAAGSVRYATWSACAAAIDDRQVMAVDVTSGPPPQFAFPHAPLEDVYESKSADDTGYDVAPDGRVLFVRDSVGALSARYPHVAENFVSDMNERLRVK